MVGLLFHLLCGALLALEAGQRLVLRLGCNLFESIHLFPAIHIINLLDGHPLLQQHLLGNIILQLPQIGISASDPPAPVLLRLLLLLHPFLLRPLNKRNPAVAVGRVPVSQQFEFALALLAGFVGLGEVPGTGVQLVADDLGQHVPPQVGGVFLEVEGHDLFEFVWHSQLLDAHEFVEVEGVLHFLVEADLFGGHLQLFVEPDWGCVDSGVFGLGVEAFQDAPDVRLVDCAESVAEEVEVQGVLVLEG